MPDVPRRSTSAGTTPLPGVRVDVGAPAAAFGVPGPAIPDLTPLTQRIADYAAKEREKADQLVLLDADNRLATLQTDLSIEATKRRGKDALGAAADVQSRWQGELGNIEGGLTNDRQRMAFRRAANSRFESLYTTVERHAAAESDRYDSEVTDTALKARINDALTNYRDPQLVAKAALELRAIMHDYGDRQEWAPEVTQAKTAEQLSRLHAGVIGRFLAVGDDRAAAAYYAKAKPQILGEHADNIDRALEEGSTLGEAQRQADAIIKTQGISRTDAYERVRAIDDPKVRRAAEQQLDTEYARQDRLQREQHDALLQRASEYADRGERPPAPLLVQLTPGERRSIESYRRSILQGEPIETDWAVYYGLMQQAAEPKQRGAFLKTNLLQYRDRLANSEFEELVKLQASAARGEDTTVRGFMSDLQIVSAVIDPLFPKAGKRGGEADDQARAQMLRDIDAHIAREKRNSGKTTLPAEAVQKITDAEVLRRVFEKGELGVDERENKQAQFLTANRLGEPYVPTEHIPESDRTKLATFLRRNGLSVSTSKIERLYAASLLRVPQQEFDAIAYNKGPERLEVFDWMQKQGLYFSDVPDSAHTAIVTDLRSRGLSVNASKINRIHAVQRSSKSDAEKSRLIYDISSEP